MRWSGGGWVDVVVDVFRGVMKVDLGGFNECVVGVLADVDVID